MKVKLEIGESKYSSTITTRAFDLDFEEELQTITELFYMHLVSMDDEELHFKVKPIKEEE